METVSVGIGSSAATNCDYDAEYHIGVIAEDNTPPVPAENATALSAALTAQEANGSFDFPCNPPGPVLGAIVLPAKEIFTAGVIRTAQRFGSMLRGSGPRSWQFPNQANDIGISTRVTRVDGQNLGAVIRLCGTSTELTRITFSGHEYNTDSSGEGPEGPGATPSGTRVPIGIELTGQNTPPSGLHVIRNCAVWSCTAAIYQRNGYYTNYSTGTVSVTGTAVTGSSTLWTTSGAGADMRIGFGSTDPDAITTWYTINSVLTNTSITLHSSAGSIAAGSAYVIEVFHDLGNGANGDNNTVENFLAYDCDTVFKSDNAQAVFWEFWHLVIGQWGGAGVRAVTVFDVVEGNDITCYGLSLNNRSSTVFQVTANSAQRLECHGLRWDTGPSPDYLTLFKFNGTPISDMSSYQYAVRVTGSMVNYYAVAYDISKLIVVPAVGANSTQRFPTNDLLFDIKGLQTDGFVKVGEGPWWHPGIDYTCDLRARWPLDDSTSSTSAKDIWKGHNGTLSVSPVPVPTFTSSGQIKGAINFANNGNYVEVPNNTALQLQNDCTIAFWIYITTSYTDGAVISKFKTGATNPQRGFRTEAAVHQFLISEEGVNKFSVPSTLLTTDSWHHVALVIDSGGLGWCYIDGTLFGTSGFTDDWFAGTDVLRFGAPASAFFGSGTNSFNGKLDDVRFYGKALSSDEVVELYNWRPQS